MARLTRNLRKIPIKQKIYNIRIDDGTKFINMKNFITDTARLSIHNRG